MISKDNIDDEELSNLCDIVENTLESIVIQFRGHFFEEGMENKLRSQFESRLAILIEKKDIISRIYLVNKHNTLKQEF
ncbi:MAG: hypothetical protein KC483_01665 [Nitrosarchaeum sp.]|nr:hypothetical protein [Nitrosarchaeum sp.]